MSHAIWKPPAASPLADQAAPRERLFWLACGAWVSILASAAGALEVVRGAFGLAHFGGLEFVPRMVALSVVREHAPGAAAMATLFALVTWAHRLDIETVRNYRARMSTQVALATLGCFPVALIVAGGASLVTGSVFYDLGWPAFVRGTREMILPRDFGAGLAIALLNVLVLGVPLGLALPASTALRWSLPAKIVSVWIALLLCRMLVGVVATLISA